MTGLQEIPVPLTLGQNDVPAREAKAEDSFGVSDEELARITWLGEGGAVRPED